MSASQSGDKLTVLEQLGVFVARLGMRWIGVGDMPGNNWSGGSRDDVNRLGSWLGLMSQSHADQGPEHAGYRGDLITAERYGERVARLTQRWVNAVPYETPRMTEHQARALSASLRDTDAAPSALTGA
ncbi:MULTISPECIES: hypothetical protein [Streptomycetaceae]|uniref:NADPH-dependent FMN reductase n=1 Tax=Streptantibioticus cattleyicolor (strain ATCC 35852 / DSM 46488 / JCM 4925 / NBRC 14057 / NRRL 8057) TaxID=1003195 RepID=F8K116_STREN|nr:MULTISPECIES: hypothetical protein [Streptomycetaceae]AEW94876.1 NADPH-dependent FMN reductase [Streptantibioticus cattleyicolor NRRL 8057 = DSM 46488]MYS59492.1 FMN reductase [Streptomyces sp. SID5468]CCB75227.1 protein of unknown function [Streptantibioticus cattleyicolor NRRL 8057 = DSM 46488]